MRTRWRRQILYNINTFKKDKWKNDRNKTETWRVWHRRKGKINVEDLYRRKVRFNGSSVTSIDLSGFFWFGRFVPDALGKVLVETWAGAGTLGSGWEGAGGQARGREGGRRWAGTAWGTAAETRAPGCEEAPRARTWSPPGPRCTRPWCSAAARGRRWGGEGGDGAGPGGAGGAGPPCPGAAAPLGPSKGLAPGCPAFLGGSGFYSGWRVGGKGGLHGKKENHYSFRLSMSGFNFSWGIGWHYAGQRGIFRLCALVSATGHSLAGQCS